MTANVGQRTLTLAESRVAMMQLGNDSDRMRMYGMDELPRQLANRSLKVVKMAMPPKDLAVVYYLLKYGRVVYVGRTRTNLFARLAAHYATKDFSEIYFTVMRHADAAMHEALEIALLKPELNLSGWGPREEYVE